MAMRFTLMYAHCVSLLLHKFKGALILAHLPHCHEAFIGLFCKRDLRGALILAHPHRHSGAFILAHLPHCHEAPSF